MPNLVAGAGAQSVMASHISERDRASWRVVVGNYGRR
jgi:hypothetical protein